MKSKPYKEVKDNLLKDPELRKEYEALSKHPEMIEFVFDVLNHFAVNLGDKGTVDWKDYYIEEDIEKWVNGKMFYVDGSKIPKDLPF